MSDPHVIVIDPNPTYETSEPSAVFTVDKDEPGWGQMLSFLRRCMQAGLIDDWTETRYQGGSASKVTDYLIAQYGERLDEVECGYEEHYDGGGEGLDEQHMREAGRIR